MLDPETRIPDLRRLGFSQSILDLSQGRIPHEFFEDKLQDPYYIYHAGTTPFDWQVIPIWEESTTATAVVETPDIIQIIEFSLECPEECELVAHSEQGLWAHFFASCMDDQTRPASSMKTVREAAQVVNFRYLKETVEFIRKNPWSENYPELLNKFTKSL
jgi:hypothetical protein